MTALNGGPLRRTQVQDKFGPRASKGPLRQAGLSVRLSAGVSWGLRDEARVAPGIRGSGLMASTCSALWTLRSGWRPLMLIRVLMRISPFVSVLAVTANAGRWGERR